MTCASKLQILPPCEDNASTEPMTTPRDRFDDVLDAFAGDFAHDDASPDELDRLYSEAVAEGLLSEETIEASFERFLQRSVTIDARTGEAKLVRVVSPTVGSQVRACRAQRALSIEQFARQHGASIKQLELLESCSEPFQPDRLPETAKSLATKIGMPVARLHTFLQTIRATLELKSAQGPELMAARKVPPK